MSGSSLVAMPWHRDDEPTSHNVRVLHASAARPRVAVPSRSDVEAAAHTSLHAISVLPPLPGGGRAGARRGSPRARGSRASARVLRSESAAGGRATHARAAAEPARGEGHRAREAAARALAF